MPLKITCPSCSETIRLTAPLPPQGSTVRCPSCDAPMAVSYPSDVVERLEQAPLDFGPRRDSTRPPALAPDDEDDAPTVMMDRDTLRAMMQADDDLGSGSAEPPSDDDAQTTLFERPVTPVEPPAEVEPPHTEDTDEPLSSTPEPSQPETAPPTGPVVVPSTGRRRPSRRKAPSRLWTWAGRGLLAAALVGALGSVAVGYAVYQTYAPDLPGIETLQAYTPATVTTVHDRTGRLLGEIYEERRYVLPYEEIPETVVHAFVAAEDANFFSHDGIDYMGIARAMVRNLRAGRIAQGGSTITQQVAKNFLLSSDRRLARKIKEALLSWRIEDAYTKEHILYLYLNEIFLGSQSYGVEAAARTFFGKHISEVTLGEAAILAGLPPRPSAWNPHRDIEASKRRQAYVLGQMVEKGFITASDAEAAAAEPIVVAPRGNTFREMAPYFTEHARRFLVRQYGEERVLNEGLSVTTTCDLDLQKAAQRAVADGVVRVDHRMGFRREDVETLSSDAERSARIAEHETAMQKAWATAQDPAGRVALPSTSTLEVDQSYAAVVTEVSKTWARVQIGIHEGMIPIAWSEWVYPPNPKKTWRYRKQDNFTRPVRAPGEETSGGGILRVGDVVRVLVRGRSTLEEELNSTFVNTPGELRDLVAVELQQATQVESSLLSADLETGHVLAMVGGSNFGRSQFNRAMQARRQVGSTFKPIVYAAALASRKITAATMVADAPLAFSTTADGEMWKPANYARDYMGNITLRRALALSRNTCTVRVLDSVDPGMQDGVVSDFGIALGLGGLPAHLRDDTFEVTPQSDVLCPWVRETPQTSGCEVRYPPRDPDMTHEEALEQKAWCRFCNLSMGLGSAALTMEEMTVAYATFANHGQWRPLNTILEVTDRDGDVLYAHESVEPIEVMDPGVADITTWLLQNVAEGGTATKARQKLGFTIAGKTGTTNEEKDAWFIGFTPKMVTAVWSGFDTPTPMGVGATGGDTSMPVFIDFMKEAVPKEGHGTFVFDEDLEWVRIDEDSGRRVVEGGRKYPFLKNTVPESTGTAAGELSLDDLTTEL